MILDCELNVQIKISDKDLGECVVNSTFNIDVDIQSTIKALCTLQLMCLNNDEDKEKYRKFIKILKNSVNEINQLYNYEVIINESNWLN